MDEDQPRRCSVEDGNFVRPCSTLQKVLGGQVRLVVLTNLKTLKRSRSFIVMKAGDFKKDGIVFNCCPFCGERIDAPFADSEAA